jgi:Ran GTPase-activating protein (RanGAP) involved in mRNA processing and transport
MSVGEFQTNCPLKAPERFVPCDPAELVPLLDFLARKEPVAETRAFPRGTLLPDGRLDLCKQALGPDGTRAVAGAARLHPHVLHLLLGADGLGDSGAGAIATLLSHNTTLRTVYLGCNAITAAGVAELAGVLHQHPSLQGLWLKRNPLGPAGAESLAAMLRHNRTLRILDLVNTDLGPEGMGSIVAALLAGASRVEHLFLCGNRLGPAEAPALAELLRRNTTLRSLYVSVNRLGDDGVAVLAESLRQNQTLRILSLSSNDLGPRGACVLASAVAENTGLRTLALGYEPSTAILGERGNHIGDDGAALLAEMLGSNRTMLRLHLERNGITRAGVRRLVDALDGNDRLLSLPLGPDVDPEWRQELDQRLRRNRAHAQLEPPDADLSAIRSVYRTARDGHHPPH